MNNLKSNTSGTLLSNSAQLMQSADRFRDLVASVRKRVSASPHCSAVIQQCDLLQKYGPKNSVLRGDDLWSDQVPAESANLHLPAWANERGTVGENGVTGETCPPPHWLRCSDASSNNALPDSTCSEHPFPTIDSTSEASRQKQQVDKKAALFAIVNEGPPCVAEHSGWTKSDDSKTPQQSTAQAQSEETDSCGRQSPAKEQLDQDDPLYSRTNELAGEDGFAAETARATHKMSQTLLAVGCSDASGDQSGEEMARDVGTVMQAQYPDPRISMGSAAEESLSASPVQASGAIFQAALSDNAPGHFQEASQETSAKSGCSQKILPFPSASRCHIELQECEHSPPQAISQFITTMQQPALRVDTAVADNASTSDQGTGPNEGDNEDSRGMTTKPDEHLVKPEPCKTTQPSSDQGAKARAGDARGSDQSSPTRSEHPFPTIDSTSEASRQKQQVDKKAALFAIVNEGPPCVAEHSGWTKSDDSKTPQQSTAQAQSEETDSCGRQSPAKEQLDQDDPLYSRTNELAGEDGFAAETARATHKISQTLPAVGCSDASGDQSGEEMARDVGTVMQAQYPDPRISMGSAAEESLSASPVQASGAIFQAALSDNAPGQETSAKSGCSQKTLYYAMTSDQGIGPNEGDDEVFRDVATKPDEHLVKLESCKTTQSPSDGGANARVDIANASGLSSPEWSQSLHSHMLLETHQDSGSACDDPTTAMEDSKCCDGNRQLLSESTIIESGHATDMSEIQRQLQHAEHNGEKETDTGLATAELVTSKLVTSKAKEAGALTTMLTNCIFCPSIQVEATCEQAHEIETPSSGAVCASTTSPQHRQDCMAEDSNMPVVKVPSPARASHTKEPRCGSDHEHDDSGQLNEEPQAVNSPTVRFREHRDQLLSCSMEVRSVVDDLCAELEVDFNRAVRADAKSTECEETSSTAQKDNQHCAKFEADTSLQPSLSNDGALLSDPFHHSLAIRAGDDALQPVIDSGSLLLQNSISQSEKTKAMQQRPGMDEPFASTVVKKNAPFHLNPLHASELAADKSASCNERTENELEGKQVRHNNAQSQGANTVKLRETRMGVECLEGESQRRSCLDQRSVVFDVGGTPTSNPAGAPRSERPGPAPDGVPSARTSDSERSQSQDMRKRARTFSILDKSKRAKIARAQDLAIGIAIGPEMRASHGLLEECLNSGQWSKAITVFKAIKWSGLPEISGRSYQLMHQAVVGAGGLDANFVAALIGQLREDYGNDLEEACVSRVPIDLAIDVAMHAVKLGLIEPVQQLITLIFETMRSGTGKVSGEASVRLFTTYFHSCIAARSKPLSMQELLEGVGAPTPMPGQVDIWSLHATALARAGQARASLEVVQSIEAAGVEPSKEALITVIAALFVGQHTSQWTALFERLYELKRLRVEERDQLLGQILHLSGGSIATSLDDWSRITSFDNQTMPMTVPAWRMTAWVAIRARSVVLAQAALDALTAMREPIPFELLDELKRLQQDQSQTHEIEREMQAPKDVVQELKWHIKNKRMDAVSDVWNQILDGPGHKVLQEIVDEVVLAFCKQKQPSSALVLLEECKLRISFEAFAAAVSVTMSSQAFRELGAGSPYDQPSVILKQRIQEAEEWTSIALAAKLPPQMVLSVAIVECAKQVRNRQQVDQAIFWYERLTSMGLVPTQSALQVLIECAAYFSQDLELFNELSTRVDDHEALFNSDVLTAARICAMAAAGRQDEARALAEQNEDQIQEKPLVFDRCMKALIKTYSDEGDAEAADELSRRFRYRSQPVLMDITRSFIKCGLLDKAFQLFQEMNGRGSSSSEFECMVHFLNQHS